MARALAANPASSTWGIRPQVRKALRDQVLALRKALEDDFRRQLVALGVHPDRTDPVPGGRTLTLHEARARQAVVAVIERAVAANTPHEAAFDAFIRDSVFTFLNRCFGLRCLEERGLLLVDGQPETAIRKDERINASSLSFRVRNELPSEASPREVWRETLRRAWQAISEHVRVVFDPDSEYGQVFPLQPTLTKVIDTLNAPEIPSDTYAEDEVWGWMYQYYNTEEKDAVYEKLRKSGKLERPDELAAATCLYTERYMVDFLVQNTLGTLWVKMHPETSIFERWPYYIRPVEGGSEQKHVRFPERVRDITLLDPACGSGHFLVRAFDVFAEMYEEEGLEPREEIPYLILERNLHGLDIDLRAIQIAALALHAKACALAGPGFRARRINLVSADVVLPGTPPGSLLAKYEGDQEIQDIIKAMWSELKDAPQLGSLLHPERRIDEALARRRRKGDTLFQQDDTAWERFRIELLEDLREEFEKEAESEDIGRRLFGEHVARGISLFEALGRRYDVVVTNPPYAAGKNLSERVRIFLTREYSYGKADLYAAFILRCLEFARTSSYTGMVTQQSWMFLRTFALLRKEVLTRTSITALAHLGPRSFEEIGGEVVSVALSTLRTTPPQPGHRLTAFRLIGPISASAKNSLLHEAIRSGESHNLYAPLQVDLTRIPETPFVYWLRPRFFRLLRAERRLRDIADVRVGLQTSDNGRFLRYFWEVPRLGSVVRGRASGRWFRYPKGGRYQKWAGLEWHVVDWGNDGREIKTFVGRGGRIASRPQNVEYYFRFGLTYTMAARGSMGARVLYEAIFDQKSPSIFPIGKQSREILAGLLSSRVCSLLLRVVTQSIDFSSDYVANLPLPPQLSPVLGTSSETCIALKSELVAQNPAEWSFKTVEFPEWSETPTQTRGEMRLRRVLARVSLLHTLEGCNERLVCDAYGLDEDDVQAVLEETGTPTGWLPLIESHKELPSPPEDVELPEELSSFVETLERKNLSAAELGRLKDRLRTLYQAGPGVKVEEDPQDRGEEEGEQVLGAHIPIPTETFLEELSVKLKVHPISVYRLLEEMREQEGLVSPPELRRAFEDYVSATILRLLGYRWPEQDAYEAEHGRIIDPGLVDPDGIIALVRCTEDPTATERVRMRMEHQFDEEGTARSLQEFRTWVGKDLDDWLKREFFRRHIQQFKQRPIAWHFTSPEGTFQAFVLYHKLSRETLERLRTKYAGGLINRLRAERERAQEWKDTNRVRELDLQIEDVEEFRSRVRAIIEGREFRYQIRCRWKGEEKEGRPGPYAPDLDDGVKVNIRPFQEAGLLEREVIKKW
ncbi:MAG TPA: BREX-1 system adenine-specific DNA-methyltransferase PglX [Actinomycetota bacterium]|nr:BREX-1 system adenine-specific DNA-methyltransferase PglX [Actinomycetota bacterium]